MLTEEQKQDVLIDVAEKFNEWMTTGSTYLNNFEAINNEVFKPAGFDVQTLRGAQPQAILDAILDCCKKLNSTQHFTWTALNAATYEANQLYDIHA